MFSLSSTGVPMFILGQNVAMHSVPQNYVLVPYVPPETVDGWLVGLTSLPAIVQPYWTLTLWHETHSRSYIVVHERAFSRKGT